MSMLLRSSPGVDPFEPASRSSDGMETDRIPDTRSPDGGDRESAAPDDDGGDAAVNAPARSVQPPLCLVGRAAERDRLSRVLENARARVRVVPWWSAPRPAWGSGAVARMRARRRSRLPRRANAWSARGGRSRVRGSPPPLASARPSLPRAAPPDSSFPAPHKPPHAFNRVASHDQNGDTLLGPQAGPHRRESSSTSGSHRLHGPRDAHGSC